MKGKRQRSADEVLKDRAMILHMVLSCPGQDTRGIALSYASQERSLPQTRGDLQFLEKIGLISKTELHSGIIWCPVQSGIQISFLGKVSVIVPRYGKGNGKIPSVPELRQQIISLTEHDFRHEWWVSKAKREFLCDLDSAGGCTTWQEADQNLSHEDILDLIHRCENTVFKVTLQPRKPLSSKVPISIESCWRVDLHPPQTLVVGDTYSCRCDCQFHVSRSCEGYLFGAIRVDRGLVCFDHREEVAVSQE